MTSSFYKVIHSTRFQLTSSILLCVYLFGLYYYQYKKNTILERATKIYKVDESIKRLSSNVEIGFYLSEFSVFSFVKNSFTMNGTIWFKFPIGAESLKTIEQFGFSSGKIIDKSAPYIKIVHGDVIVSYDITVEFRSNLNYYNFPMGGHRLYFTLENRSVSPNELNFISTAENFELDKDILVDTWKAVHKNVETGYEYATNYKKNPVLNFGYPIATFSIDFKNNSAREIFTLYFPLFFIFFLAFFILMVEIKEDLMRLNFLLIPLPLLVLDRLVIDSLSPTASVITKIDFIYFLLVFLSLLIVLFQMYSTLVLRSVKHLSDDSVIKNKKIEFLRQTNDLVFVSVIILLVTLLSYNALT